MGLIMRQILISLSLLIICMSCAKETGISTTDIPGIHDEYSSVTMVIPPFEFDDDSPTRNVVDLGNLSYVWAATDTVGIFPDKGSQIYFSMASGAGQASAKFDGGGWALKKSSSYYSYFPFVADYYIEKNAIPISFEGQIQEGNGNLESASLGNYCFMAAKGTADLETGSLYFNYERLGVLFMILLPVEAGEYEYVDICAGKKVIASSGTMDAVAVDSKIHDAVYSDCLRVALKDVTFDAPGTLIAIAMLPPFNIYSEQLTFNLKRSDGKMYTSSVFGKEFALGKAYRHAANISVSSSVSELAGEGGTFNIEVTAAGNSSYSIATDSDWLSLSAFSGSGSGIIRVTASKNTSAPRIGHVTVSETVTYKGASLLLQNIITVNQDMFGLNIGVRDWESDGNDYGGEIE